MSLMQGRGRRTTGRPGKVTQRGRFGRFAGAVGSAVRGAAGGRMRGHHRRRARGITAVELRGARKVARLVKLYGMRPKTGAIKRRK